MATETTTTYLGNIRDLAQSVLAGIQGLEDLSAATEDDGYSNAELALRDADSDVWALVDWIDEGRPE